MKLTDMNTEQFIKFVDLTNEYHEKYPRSKIDIRLDYEELLINIRTSFMKTKRFNDYFWHKACEEAKREMNTEKSSGA